MTPGWDLQVDNTPIIQVPLLGPDGKTNYFWYHFLSHVPSEIQALVDAVSGLINSQVYTVATLPASQTGTIARVSDSIAAPAWGSVAVGGHSSFALLVWNGANWTVIGV